MSDFGKETCATAIAAPVADQSQKSWEEEEAKSCLEEVAVLAEPLVESWRKLIHPLLQKMDQNLDCRLVYTLERTVLSVLQHRNRATGLLLSELGGFLCGPDHAPAGTKRLSNLLRSKKWAAEAISHYLWARAIATWDDMVVNGEEALMLWDDSVLEKSESLKSEGLCPVRSSKAKRLTHIKPGYYRPPGAPIFVPGFHWSSLLLIGRSGPPTVAAMRWWSTRRPESSPAKPAAETPVAETPVAEMPVAAVGERANTDTSTDPDWFRQQREVALELLKQCAHAFRLGVLHIFDRGYAGEPWLSVLDQHLVRFVLRWPKKYALEDFQGIKKSAWKLLRGKRFMATFQINDGPGKRRREVKLKVVQVFHPAYGHGLCPLWLVVSTPEKGKEPWYLLTNENIASMQDALDIVTAYARRWQIEACFRFNKTELALESPRLWTWERRLKLLMIVTLVYALLLDLLQFSDEWRNALFKRWCHRTGKRSRETPTPLYRLRAALAALTLFGHLQLRFYQSSG